MACPAIEAFRVRIGFDLGSVRLHCEPDVHMAESTGIARPVKPVIKPDGRHSRLVRKIADNHPAVLVGYGYASSVHVPCKSEDETGHDCPSDERPHRLLILLRLKYERINVPAHLKPSQSDFSLRFIELLDEGF